MVRDDAILPNDASPPPPIPHILLSLLPSAPTTRKNDRTCDALRTPARTRDVPWRNRSYCSRVLTILRPRSHRETLVRGSFRESLSSSASTPLSSPSGTERNEFAARTTRTINTTENTAPRMPRTRPIAVRAAAANRWECFISSMSSFMSPTNACKKMISSCKCFILCFSEDALFLDGVNDDDDDDDGKCILSASIQRFSSNVFIA
mmetsp:Transcript_23042/g.41529  ORF Transcript_23042/g.41529 Transcript_23042/m.41529 type:complete len:206 (-) Transcript_23042:989-1606(-)